MLIMINKASEFHCLTLACPKTLLVSSCSRKIKIFSVKFKFVVRKNLCTTVKYIHLSVKITGYITTILLSWNVHVKFQGSLCKRGTAVEQWLRCCATNRKVAGSIPDGVIGIFHWHNPPDRTMALWSTQPLTEMRFPGGKCGRCVRLTTLPPPCAAVMKSGNLNFLEPSGPLQACNGTDCANSKCNLCEKPYVCCS